MMKQRSKTRHKRAPRTSVQRRSARETPFSGRGGRSAVEKYRRPDAILQLNTEGLTTSKASVIERLAAKYKASVILLQETHCVSPDMLVIPKFTLAGFTLSRKHGIATFVHEDLNWVPVDQSSANSELEWVCVDVSGYNIVNIYKPPP